MSIIYLTDQFNVNDLLTSQSAINFLLKGSIIMTKSTNKKFLNVLYILGIPTIHVLNDENPILQQASFVDNLEDFVQVPKSHDYDSLLEIVQYNKIQFKEEGDTQDKFQKTILKEAKKLQYAENREKYKTKMRQNSLSNKKSLEKSLKKNQSKDKEQKVIEPKVKEPKEPKDKKS
jgi:hypothetical protein